MSYCFCGGFLDLVLAAERYSTLPVSRSYFDNTNTKEIETMQDIFLITLLDTAAAWIKVI